MKLPIYLIVIFFLSCGQRSEHKSVNQISVPTQTMGKKYFIYDSVIYYHINFHDSSLPDLNYRDDESILDSLKREVILGHTPKDTNDLMPLDKFEKMGFQKKNLDKALFNRIDTVFSEKTPGERIVTACGQIYRDILIFKKSKSVVGIAKICFSCGDYVIIGTGVNTEGFEQNGAYSKLKDILKE